MRIDFNVEDGYDYAKARFFEMSGLSAEQSDGAAAYERIKNQINIRAVVREFDGAIDGETINLGSGIVECAPIKNLRGSIYAYVLTVGELELSSGTLERTLDDMWGTAFVDAGLEILRNKIAADNPEKFVSHPFGPGFYGIKIDAIKTIFDALDCKNAGVDLKNGLLTPMKSSIGFFLVSDSEEALPSRDCAGCAGGASRAGVVSCEYCKNSGKKTVKIIFKNENKTIAVPVGTIVADAARQAGITIETPCGGTGKCGKCEGIIETNGETKIAKLCMERAYSDMTVCTKAYAASKTGDTKTNVYVRGNSRYDDYSLAVDIGTTTLEAVLIGGAEIIARAANVNPQAAYAADVIGRIRLASEGDALHNLIINTVNFVIDEIIVATEIGREQITKCVIAGNTAMQCIAAGINPRSLGQYPYNVPDMFGRCIDAAELGINIPSDVYFPPVISAFVGGDIACGIAVARLWECNKTLLIDIGTNGELAYVKDGKIIAASAAAGPAFEGMGITFGMRAEPGAVSRFKIMNRNTVMVETIDKAPAIGICGSGLLDIVAELVKNGIITGDGAFCDKRLITSPIRNRLCEYQGEAAFKICGEVYLTQGDIRQVQLAKGAIRAVVETAAKDAERIIVAGTFGKHTSEESLAGCGILPEVFAGKIEFMGNTSLDGAILLLKDEELREELCKIVSSVETVMLSENEEFERLFVKYMNFVE